MIGNLKNMKTGMTHLCIPCNVDYLYFCKFSIGAVLTPLKVWGSYDRKSWKIESFEQRDAQELARGETAWTIHQCIGWETLLFKLLTFDLTSLTKSRFWVANDGDVLSAGETRQARTANALQRDEKKI